MSELKPNLFVIGAMKCATTSLHSFLNQHPQIFMSEIKEINFFVPQYRGDNDLDWYLNQFSEGFDYRGESSQNYSKRHLISDVPKNLFNFQPNAKLIYIIRNPIDRYISHIHEAISQENRDINYNPNTESLQELKKSNYVLTGMYYFQIESFLKFFTDSQIKIVLLEELKKDYLSTMNEIFQWLGLKNMKDSELKLEARNSFQDKRVPNLFGKMLRNTTIKNIIGIFKPFTKYLNKLMDVKTLLSSPLNPIELEKDTKINLSSIFLPDIQMLIKWCLKSEHNKGILNGLIEYQSSLEMFLNENK